MNVLNLALGADTGGQGFRMQRAVNRYLDGWNARAIRREDTYIKYPRDLRWDKTDVQHWYDWADIVHHGQGLKHYAELDNGQHKRTVLHHHGTRFRTNPEAIKAEAKSVGAVQAVSTLDLLNHVDATWIPSPYDLAEMMRYKSRRPGPLRIIHSPTDRGIKGTRHVLRAVENLQKRYDVELDLVEKAQWKVCLSRKGNADIFIDQFHLGYGNNAVEAWAMGIPVIAGVNYMGTRDRMVEAFGELPFVDATPETLESRLAELITSKELRDEWGARGRAHVERFHDEAVVAEMLRTLYESTPPSWGNLRIAA